MGSMTDNEGIITKWAADGIYLDHIGNYREDEEDRTGRRILINVGSFDVCCSVVP